MESLNRQHCHVHLEIILASMTSMFWGCHVSFYWGNEMCDWTRTSIWNALVPPAQKKKGIVALQLAHMQLAEKAYQPCYYSNIHPSHDINHCWRGETTNSGSIERSP